MLIFAETDEEVNKASYKRHLGTGEWLAVIHIVIMGGIRAPMKNIISNNSSDGSTCNIM